MKKSVILIFLLILLKSKAFATPNDSYYYIEFLPNAAFLAYVGYSYYDTQNQKWHDFYLPAAFGASSRAQVAGFINSDRVNSCIDIITYVHPFYIVIGRNVFAVIDRNAPKTKITTWGTTLDPQFGLENIESVGRRTFEVEWGKRLPCRPPYID